MFEVKPEIEDLEEQLSSAGWTNLVGLEDAERELRERGLPNLLSHAEKFTEEELLDLYARLKASGTDPGRSAGAKASAPED